MPNRYGWVPDVPDQRDHLFHRVCRIPLSLPKKVDLRPGCSPVEDQGDLGSCTANALAGALEFLELKDKATFKDVSRLFVYYNERVMEGTVNSDAGAMIRDGIKTLNKQGWCSETSWPYDISKFTRKPPAGCYREAMNRQILTYARIQTLVEMKGCLALGFPFVFGFAVYESFESDAVAKTGNVPMPKKGERMLGGHAVLGVGYDDSRSRFIVRNSWGPDWAVGGYFTMPYQYLTDPNLADDFWNITKQEC
jgi:C1A family cysteine protease